MNATTIQTDDKESSRWTPRGLGLMPSTGGQQLGIKAANFAPKPTQSKDANASKNHLVEALVHALPPMRVVWLMVPSGHTTEATIAELASRLNNAFAKN